jgi:ribonuclease J
LAEFARDELIFLPLGGCGEIGMNLNLYGFGGKWLMVDLGITFADETLPGVDVVTPDPTFIEERRDDLVGLILTHAHEDHLGAVPWLWPRLKCPIYATPFAAAVLRRKLDERQQPASGPLHVVPLGGRIALPPFDVELISLTHSIPEPNALAIRTPVGTVMHTGDWKIDPEPLIGEVADEVALRRLGDAGVLAMVCDSTNVFVPGVSGSEGRVRERLIELVADRAGRVAITAFASNIARVKIAADVARSHGRHLAIVGRSMWRMTDAARETGYLGDIGPVLDDVEGAHLPPGKVLYLCTGSQGEPRGALARIAANDHPNVVLDPGDVVIFSSRVIPGNERAIARIQNLLAGRGVGMVNDRDGLVHVSGHPNRDELAQMYQWIRPRIAVPVHGELRHLVEHAALARQLQVPHGAVLANGQALRLAPGPHELVGEVQAGRWVVDGAALQPASHGAVRARRKLGFDGGGVVTLVADAAGRLLAPPTLVLQGVPSPDGDEALRDEALAAVDAAIRALPAGARADDGRLGEAARLAVRRTVRARVGKKPAVEAQVIRIAAAG